MALTSTGVENLAKLVDLRIEALNTPNSGGQAQVFQVRPSALLLSASGALIPTDTVLNSAIPVPFSVKWGVEDVGGTPLGPEEAVTYSKPGAKTPRGIEQALEATVMVLPDFVELGGELPTKTLYVTATVTVERAGDQTTELKLLRHPISVPAIPIPTVAIFFAKPDLGVVNGELNPEFPHFALIAVPRDSPIAGVTALRDACEQLQEVAKRATQLVGLAGLPGVGLPPLHLLGVGLGTLLDSLNLYGIRQHEVGVAFLSADFVRNLNNVDMIDGWFRNDIEAEDTISSFVLLGPPGRRLGIYQDRHFGGRHATISASNACITIVNDLSTVPPTTLPPEQAEQAGGPALDNRISGIAFLAGPQPDPPVIP